jgi:hypothetical protein
MEIAPMAVPVQLIVQNATPQRRGIFILSRKLDTASANSIALGAWQRFTFEPGGGDRTAFTGGLQVVARSQNPDAQHQSVMVDAAQGASWDFALDGDNAPMLTPGSGTGDGDIAVANRTANRVAISFYDNFAPLIPAIVLRPDSTISYMPVSTLYFYATVPLADEHQPIVLAPEIGELTISADTSVPIAQFVQDGDKLEWRFT